MSTTTEDIVRVCEALPPDKQNAVADFARFLLARQADEAWEQRLAYPQSRPRLDVFLRDAAAEGDDSAQRAVSRPGRAPGRYHHLGLGWHP